jgi:hypothetical protein
VNIRTSGEYDAVADFAKAVADPADPEELNPAYNPGIASEVALVAGQAASEASLTGGSLSRDRAERGEQHQD